jgi:hypothetical protein
MSSTRIAMPGGSSRISPPMTGRAHDADATQIVGRFKQGPGQPAGRDFIIVQSCRYKGCY